MAQTEPATRGSAARAMRVRSAMRSDQGRVRTENQDGCAAAPDIGVYALVDGMGGAAGGELASSLALETFLHSMGQTSAAAERGAAEDRLEDAVSAANA